MLVDKFYMYKVYMRRLETFLTIYVKLLLKIGKLVTSLTAQGGCPELRNFEPIFKGIT
ncbi:unnamed protein product [marine sediment metagenome]|uniref:Uncharacterized protein n=1 Tax=marine sediment metagenome TaxID=412755 RepID=X1KHY0_9ZZZZ